MKNLLSTLTNILLFGFAIFSSALTLEGEWTLLSVGNIENVNMQVTLSDLIFRQQQIISKIQFKSCQRLVYQTGIENDNIYINIESEWMESIRNCNQDEQSQLNNIRRWIRDIFKFQIENNQLAFFDAFEVVLFRFKRASNISRDEWARSLSGSWMVQTVQGSSVSYSMMVNVSEFSVCSGASFSYTISSLYRISIKSKSKGDCKDEELIANFLSAKFYRKIGDNLQFYDSSINLVLTAVFSPQLIIEKQAPQISRPSSANSMISQTSEKSGFSLGNYYLLLLAKRSLGRIQAQVTQSSIFFKVCSQLIFSYSIKDSKTIHIESNSKLNSNCQKVDESIYMTALTSIVQFEKDVDQTVRFLDKNGVGLVSLAKF